MFEQLTQFQISYGYLINPLIVGTLVAIVCSVIGCFIVLRGMSFLADAIAHSMLAGVIGGFLLMKIFYGVDASLFAMLVGAILAGILTVAMVGFVTRFSRIKQDTSIGIMYTGIFAVGSFLMSIKSIAAYVDIDIYHFVVGDVISVSDSELWLLTAVTSIVLSVVILFYRPLQLTTFDPVMAASIGIPVLAVEYLLTACTSLVVVSGVQIVGVVLVVALIITPAASAYLLTDRLDRMILLSAILGVIGFWTGFFFANWFNASPGSTVVISMTAIFMACLALAPRYGLLADWIRKNNTVPQETMEDVLGSALRHPGKFVPIDEILGYIDKPNPKIRKSISMLQRQGLLDVEGLSIRLTEDGEFEARRLVRAHRLWETYLDRTSVPKEEIHQRAHRLEHLQDPEMVDYLDDKLGHPLTDPHGSEIPMDEQRFKDREIMLSLLREGNQAVVMKVMPGEVAVDLKVGQVVSVGPRSDDGKIWNVITQSGQKMQLNHQEADRVLVRLEAGTG